jgi:hypothetical protein
MGMARVTGIGALLALGLLLEAGAIVQANTDLLSLLAAAPSADWIEAGSTPTVLEGQFTAASYSAYLQSVDATPNTIEGVLNLYGFRDGYAREWEQRGTDDILTERVFEFGDSRGASYWYRDLALGVKTDSSYTSDIPAAAAIPNSFGVLLTYSDGKQWRVEFAKGNLVFIVHADAGSDDLAALAVSQAAQEYDSAPSSTVGTAAAAKPLVPESVLIFAGVVFALIALGALATGLAVGMRGRRSSAFAQARAGTQMSPDGAHWWDGARWRPAASDPPPSAQRSPDGAYWWDGTTWRPIAR